MAKFGRNDLCPCGSGNKFKRCHIENWPPTAAHSIVDSHELLAPLNFVELATFLRSSLDATGLHPISIVASVLKRFREKVELLESQTDEGIHVRSAGAAVLAACYRNDIDDYQQDRIPVAIDTEADRLLMYVRMRLENQFGTSLNQPLLTLIQNIVHTRNTARTACISAVSNAVLARA